MFLGKYCDDFSNPFLMLFYTLTKILSIIGDITLQSISPSTIDKFIKGMSGLCNAGRQMSLAHLKACINEAIRK